MGFSYFFILFTIAFSGPAHADDSILVRSQWRTANINEPNIIYLKKLNGQHFQISGGINLNEKSILKSSDTGSCINFLSKLIQYPLQKMYDGKSISREQYDFYRKYESHLDPRQVVFFNTAIPKVQKLEIRYISMDADDPFGIQKQVNRTLMENFSALNDPSLSNEELVNETAKMLEMQSSMWLVRDHVLEKDGSISKRTLPWHTEEEYKPLIKNYEKGMNFELGRATTENHDDLQTILNASILTAANDVVTSHQKLTEATVFAQAISKAHTRLYEKYGFQLVKKSDAGEFLMQANLETLYKKLNPLNDFHETSSFSNYFPSDPITAIEFRNKMRGSLTQFLEQPNSPSNKPLLIHFNEDWHAFAMDELDKLPDEKRRNFIYHPGASPEIFADQHIPDYVMNSRTGGNNIYGLDSEALAKDPNYLGKTITGVYLHYMNEVNKTSRPTQFGHNLIFESPMVFFTEDKNFVEAAKKMGAEVSEVNSTKRSVNLSKHEVTKIEKNGYQLKFSAPLVKMIGSHYYTFSHVPELKPGITQLQYLRLNGL